MQIYQQWIDKSDKQPKYYQTFNSEVSDDLEAKYKQNTYSVKDIYSFSLLSYTMRYIVINK